jgi:hypothetical protein
MVELNAHAAKPDVCTAYKALVRYLDVHRGALTPEQIETGTEMKRRLKRLESEANRLIAINNVLLDESGSKVEFDQSADTLTFTYKGSSRAIRINRAHPDKPITIPASVSSSGYVAGRPSRESERVDELKSLMEQMLEGMYSNAFRITKLAQALTGSRKFECRKITVVRNKLVEHPEPGSIYSFGFGSNGPVVKPIHRGKREWTDLGVVPNLEAFRDSLLRLLAEDA